nr:ribonuclease [Pseudohoeflea sp. DP4N28-3]
MTLAAVAGAAFLVQQPQPDSAPGPVTASIAAETVPLGTGFDFYVLALSWSPSYCLAEGRGRRDSQQCGQDADFGFIVHGLWPQFEAGYPQYCPTRQPDRVPARLGQELQALTPSMGLIGHMWRKHGSCSGLSQEQYFDVVRAAAERVRVPERFRGASADMTLSAQAAEELFIAANPGLRRDGIAAVCESGRLREVRVCLTHELQFRSCAAVDRSGCRASRLTVPQP